MTTLEKALLKAEEAFDKALFEAAVEELVVENNKKETEKTSRLEELETKLNGIDEASLFGDLYDDFKAYEIMMLFEEEDNLLDNELFVNPNKESRRRTRKANISHKSRNIRGKDYLNYGKSKTVGRDIHWERLYNGGNGIRSKKRIDDKEKAMRRDMYSPDPFEWHVDEDGSLYQEFMLTDGYKGEYRVIEGKCYPIDYITDEEHSLLVQVASMDRFGKTNENEDIALIYIFSISDDGKGKISEVEVLLENKGVIYKGNDFEKANTLFELLSVK